MTKEQIQQKILNIIAKIAQDADTTKLDPNLKLREQLSLDSMDFLDIVMELRKEYGIAIPETEYANLATLSGATDYLHSILGSRQAR